MFATLFQDSEFEGQIQETAFFFFSFFNYTIIRCYAVHKRRCACAGFSKNVDLE